MNSKQWKEWGYIVGACKSGASSINVGSKCRRDAILAADADITALLKLNKTWHNRLWDSLSSGAEDNKCR